MGWNRMQNGRRSLGAVQAESPLSGVSIGQRPLRRTRSAHAARRPLTYANTNFKILSESYRVYSFEELQMLLYWDLGVQLRLVCVPVVIAAVQLIPLDDW